MKIEQFNSNQLDQICLFVKTAFQTAEVADGSEQDMVKRIINSKRYIPELTLVATEDSETVGFVLICKTYITNGDKSTETLNLGPVAVKQSLRGKGIGSELIRTAIENAKHLGYKSVFLAGNTSFYSRFGFTPSINFGIKCNVPVPDELLPNIMALEIQKDALKNTNGIVDLTLENI